jgi:hypothetical protein
MVKLSETNKGECAMYVTVVTMDAGQYPNGVGWSVLEQHDFEHDKGAVFCIPCDGFYVKVFGSYDEADEWGESMAVELSGYKVPSSFLDDLLAD